MARIGFLGQSAVPTVFIQLLEMIDKICHCNKFSRVENGTDLVLLVAQITDTALNS